MAQALLNMNKNGFKSAFSFLIEQARFFSQFSQFWCFYLKK